MRNDVLARYVQVVPLLLIFLVTARLARAARVRADRRRVRRRGGRAVAGRSSARSLAPKDDLIVTAFFACAVLSLAGATRATGSARGAPALAFGMVLASKYTILLACPLFLFMIDAPLRAIRAESCSARRTEGAGRPSADFACEAACATRASLKWCARGR